MWTLDTHSLQINTISQSFGNGFPLMKIRLTNKSLKVMKVSVFPEASSNIDRPRIAVERGDILPSGLSRKKPLRNEFAIIDV